MKRILMKNDDPTDGVSNYRFWGPMIELEKEGHVVLQQHGEDAKQVTNWINYRRNHVFFLTRPCSTQARLSFIEAEKHGMPVWVDVDDNVWELPDDNPSFEYFSQTAKDNLSYCVSHADVVTVATRKLASYIRKHFKREVIIIPNAQQDYFFNRRRPLKRNRHILWRGSPSHHSDLQFYQPWLIEVLDKHRSFDWTFMGMNPYYVVRYLPDNKHVNWSLGINHVDYMIQGINTVSATFNWVAMIDREFSRTRSFNAWHETTIFGAVTMAPKWEEWDHDGVFHYTDEKNFVEKFNEFLHLSDAELERMYKASVNYVGDNLLSKMNQKRLEILNNL